MGLFKKKKKDIYDGMSFSDELKARMNGYIERQISWVLNSAREAANRGDHRVAIGGMDPDIIDKVIERLVKEGLKVDKSGNCGFTVDWSE